MKFYDKIIIDDYCPYSITIGFMIIYGYLYTLIDNKLPILTHIIIVCLILGCFTFSIYRYFQVCYLIKNGIKMDAKVEVYRKSYISHNYVKLKYFFNSEEITQKRDLSDMRINKNKTAHIIVHPLKPRIYIVLFASDRLETLRKYR